MSSLWTPGGEHPVGDGPPGPTVGADEPQLTPEQEAALTEAAAEMAQVRERLADTPVEMVVANHVMGLYELAAIHLNREQPDLVSARVAIDALGGAMDACKGRLGEHEAVLVEARTQLQMAFVSVADWVRSQAGGA